MDYNYKPKYLPQISAPYSILFSELKKEGIGYKVCGVDLSEITPTQGLVFSDKINNIQSDNLKSIFLSKENKIVDGHHRYASAISSDLKKIKSIIIDLPFMEAIRVLNRIQDIYDYEIKLKNDIDENKKKSFLHFLELENEDKRYRGKTKKIKGYRATPINYDSKIGNFFMLQNPDDKIKYEFEIEFESLLDTDELDINFIKSETPPMTLSKFWFPNINFSKIADEYDVHIDIIINRAIAEKAMKFGYDGIKYGDILLQALK